MRARPDLLVLLLLRLFILLSNLPWCGVVWCGMVHSQPASQPASQPCESILYYQIIYATLKILHQLNIHNELLECDANTKICAKDCYAKLIMHFPTQ
jgi:hypothetical protein